MSLKTNKTIAKRFQIKKSTKGKKKVVKLLKRANGQDHFNARADGATKRRKRKDVTMTKTLTKTILRGMPHNV